MRLLVVITVFASISLMQSCEEEVVAEKKPPRRAPEADSTILVFSEDPVVIESPASEKTVSGSSFIKVNSNDTLVLQWNKIEHDIPPSWNVYFCDNVVCHFVCPDSSVMHPIDSTTDRRERRLKLYVEPNGVEGSGQVDFVLTDKKLGVLDTLTYIVDFVEGQLVEDPL